MRVSEMTLSRRGNYILLIPSHWKNKTYWETVLDKGDLLLKQDVNYTFNSLRLHSSVSLPVQGKEEAFCGTCFFVGTGNWFTPSSALFLSDLCY